MKPFRCLGVRVLSFFVALFIATQAEAQEQGQPAEIQGGVGIVGAVPVGEFGDHVEDAGGVSGHLGVGIGSSPFSLGGEISYINYGNENRKVPLSPTIPDVPVTVNTENSVVLFHARLRVQVRTGRWRPYADGLFGLSYIYTRSSVAVDSSDSSSSLGGNNISDTGMSYGGGGGVMIRMSQSQKVPKLDISVRFIAGPKADYLTQGAIRRENGQAILDVTRSRTDLVTLGIAATWAR